MAEFILDRAVSVAESLLVSRYPVLWEAGCKSLDAISNCRRSGNEHAGSRLRKGIQEWEAF